MLIALGALYCLASFVHFAHNAMYLWDYPNLPPSFTAAGVWAAWCAVTAVGLLGFWLLRRSRKRGLLLTLLYALLGFGGFDHYVLAPMAAHSTTMNATIWLEASAAAGLFAYVCYLLMCHAYRANDRHRSD